MNAGLSVERWVQVRQEKIAHRNFSTAWHNIAFNAKTQRWTLGLLRSHWKTSNLVNRVKEISVGLSVQSVQRQAQAFNAGQVALNAGTIEQDKEIKKISVEVRVQSVQRKACSVERLITRQNLAKSENPEKFSESSVYERWKQRSTLNCYNNGKKFE